MAAVSDKTALRKTALARRAAAHVTANAAASGYLSAVLAGHRGVPISGYSPMRSEIDPLPAMKEAAAYGAVGMPVIVDTGQPLQFAIWAPDCAMVPGHFGAMVPESGVLMTPQIVVVPLVAFDLTGARLGYGGGFYDRTLQQLRRNGPLLAVGFAYDAQALDHVPQDPTDQGLDMIVTETGVVYG